MNGTTPQFLAAAKTGIGGATLLIAANSQPIFFAATCAMLLLIIIGVLLPAVWSSRRDRRQDARSVLRLLLHHLVRSRTG